MFFWQRPTPQTKLFRRQQRIVMHAVYAIEEMKPPHSQFPQENVHHFHPGLMLSHSSVCLSALRRNRQAHMQQQSALPQTYCRSSSCFGSPSESIIHAPFCRRLLEQAGSAHGSGTCTSSRTPAPCAHPFHRAWHSRSGYLRPAVATCFACCKLPTLISPRASSS